MIPWDERDKMRAVPLCGPKVIERLETIGITSLADLRGQNPVSLVERVHLSVGAPIWRHPRALRAVTNLVHAAENDPGYDISSKESPAAAPTEEPAHP